MKNVLAPKTLLKARLTRVFPEPVGCVLSDFELSCDEGEITVLLGPSGCGKSTILTMLVKFLSGQSVAAHREKSIVESSVGTDFAYASQIAELVPWRNAQGNVYLELDLLGIPRGQSTERVEFLLSQTGLVSAKSLLPDELSVGMQQRVQTVRAAARSASLFLFDEPLSAVDLPQRTKIAGVLRDLIKSKNAAAIWVTHDPLEAAIVADKVIVVGGRPLGIGTKMSIGTPNRQLTSKATWECEAGDRNNNESVEVTAQTLQEVLFSQWRGGWAPPELNEQSGLAISSGTDRWNFEHMLLAFLPLIVLLLVWEASIAFFPELQFFLSRPSEWIPLLLRELTSTLFIDHVLTTLRESFFGLAIGMPFGIVVGLLAGVFGAVGTALRPTLVGLTAVPLFVLAPAFILWFGIGEQMKVAIAAISCFPFVSTLVMEGTHQAKGDLYKYLAGIGVSTRSLLVHLVLPASLKAIISSLRPAAVAALIGAFLGEFIAANSGLGYYILLEASRYRVDAVVVGVAVLFALAVGVDLATKSLTKRSILIIAKLGL